MQAIKQSGFPANKVLGAGIIDGRGIWKASLREKLSQLEELTKYVAPERLIVQSSCASHVPVTVSAETKLRPELKGALAFADEKLNELVLLTKAISTGADRIFKELEACDAALQALKQSGERNRHDIQQAVAEISAQNPVRSLPFAERHVAQQNKWKSPIFRPRQSAASRNQPRCARHVRRGVRRVEP